MSYKFKKSKKKINFGKNKGERYVATIANNRMVTHEEFVKYIEEAGTVAKQDVGILFREMSNITKESFALGRGLNFRKLGVLLPNLSTEGSDTAKEVSANKIETVTTNFRPSPELRRQMDNAKVEQTTKYDLKHE